MKIGNDATPTLPAQVLYVEPNPDQDVTHIYRVFAVDADGDEGLIGFKAHCRIGLDSWLHSTSGPNW